MPWSARDAHRHTKKAESKSEKQRWARIANAVRRHYKGKKLPEKIASKIAIKVANKRLKESSAAPTRSPLLFEQRNVGN